MREEEQWKNNLLEHSAKEAQRQIEDQSLSFQLYSVLCLSLKSLGNVFGLPGTLTRRISIQRAATISPRTNVSQVIIKNTTALRDFNDSSNTTPASIGRSQSLLSTNRVPILAPKRVDRLRMECTLADVWTRDILPFPGMSANRGEHLIRNSANSVMRKLSRASLASNFTKRSASLATVADDKSCHTEVSITNEEIIDLGRGLRTRKSMASFVSLLLEGDEPVASCNVEPITKTAFQEGPQPKRDDFSYRNRQDLASSAKGGATARPHNKSAEALKSRRRRPEVLLKTFSGEGIRSWFN